MCLQIESGLSDRDSDPVTRRLRAKLIQKFASPSRNPKLQSSSKQEEFRPLRTFIQQLLIKVISTFAFTLIIAFKHPPSPTYCLNYCRDESQKQTYSRV